MNRWIGSRAVLALAAGLALSGLTAVAGAAQQAGTLQGTVMDGQTARPLSGVQVSLPGTQFGTITNAQGRFQLINVPAGTHTLRAEMIGYTAATREVTIAAGATTTETIRLEPTAVALQEVVVTGVAGATMRAKVPFDVATLSMADLPVPAVSAGTAIQGKVAGAQVVQGSGRPGSPPSILLRGATSIDASGRGQEPLYIVDGVILGSTMIDIDGLDIENIEVVKGAAAASLFGSRAANGVVQITTRRGGRAAENQVRYTARTEFGQSEIAATPSALLTQRHHWATIQTDSGTFFLSAAGNPCRFELCPNLRLAGQGRSMDPETGEPIGAANAWNTYQDQVWPGQTYDQVQQFFRPGQFQQHYVSAEGRSGATTFHLSYSSLLDRGIIPGLDGFSRQNVRLNLDQAIRDNLQVSASAFYSRGSSDQFTESQNNPIWRLTRQPAGVNLKGCIDDPAADCTHDPQRLVLATHPDFRTESANPLYEVLTREHNVERGRFLGSSNVRLTPRPWLDLDLNASYDRLDYEEENYLPLGYRTVTPSATQNRGSLSRYIELTEALNASATATFHFNVVDGVRNRTQLRYLWEQQDQAWNWTRGWGFQVADIRQFQNLDQDNILADSDLQPIRSDGYFAITNFDIRDRYIVDALIRNDGSSLFGAEQRRAWYYRLAGAWRMAEEPWFPLRGRGIDEFKVRAALGTAGNRPRFEAQYETFAVEGGRVTPQTLGNVELRPEFSRELELGVDASLLDGRFVVALSHAHVVTEDQILRVPLPGFTGYTEQWRNAGTLQSNIWEASLDTRLLQTRDLTWRARLLFDRTRSTITELDVAPFTYGVSGQNLHNVFYARPGERIGTFYGIQYATSCAQLPAGMSCDGFAVNNDGFLVWAGEGGLANPAWGSLPPGEVTGGAPHLAAMMWGVPFAGVCADPSTGEETTYCRLGNTMPDYSIGLSSTVTWRGFSVYGLLDAQQGFHVYNQPLQWATFRRTAGLLEQSPDLPVEERKPIGYYDILYNASGLRPASPYIEDASFVKLREVSLGYRVGADRLAGLPGMFNGLGGIAVNLTGRNLFTWSGYRGYDPEVGRATAPTGGASPGSAAIARVDGYQYPNFRTWTLGLELNF